MLLIPEVPSFKLCPQKLGHGFSQFLEENTETYFTY
jgi:hypothetical protein